MHFLCQGHFIMIKMTYCFLVQTKDIFVELDFQGH